MISKIKKHLTILVIVFSLVVLSSATISAEDPLTSKISDISSDISMIEKLPLKTIANVKGTLITNHDILKYKAYNQVSEKSLSDDEILELLITEELFLQLAEEKGVAASLDDGYNLAREYRQILMSQEPDVLLTHAKLLTTMGMSEEHYWNVYAPKEYQKQMSIQNLTDFLIKEKVIDSSDPKLVMQQLNDFKKQLLRQNMNMNVQLYYN